MADSKQIVKKIDIHAHTVRVLGIPRVGGSNFALPHELIEMYDILGVEKGVLLPTVSPDCGFTTSTNEENFEIARANPERFAFFCCIDPRVGNNSPETDFGYFVKYYKEQGAKGCGEMICNLYFDDPKVLALFKACEEYDMPITFHIGHTNGEYGLIDDFGLPRLEKVLQMFPNLKFLAHSQRFWSHISGDVNEETMHGWPQGTVTEGGRVVELMRKYPNLCGDLSAGSGFNAVSRDPEFGYKFIEEFQDKLYFGLDLCDPDNINQKGRIGLVEFLDTAMLEGKISYEAYLKVSRENALKILK